MPEIFREAIEQVTQLSSSSHNEQISCGLYVLRKMLQNDVITQFKPDKSLLKVLQSCLEGKFNHNCTKYASDIICYVSSDNTTLVLSDTVADMADAVAEGVDMSAVTCGLIGLGRICLKRYEAVRVEERKVLNYIVRQLLVQNNTPTTGTKEDEWVGDEDLAEECHSKMAALQFLTNRAIALLKLNNNNSRDNQSKVEALEAAKSLLKILFAFLLGGGDISKEQNSCESFKPRLRLCASLCIVKLIRQVEFEKLISLENFQTFAMIVQVSLPIYYLCILLLLIRHTLS